jgi:hypothetical protein
VGPSRALNFARISFATFLDPSRKVGIKPIEHVFSNISALFLLQLHHSPGSNDAGQKQQSGTLDFSSRFAGFEMEKMLLAAQQFLFSCRAPAKHPVKYKQYHTAIFKETPTTFPFRVPMFFIGMRNLRDKSFHLISCRIYFGILHYSAQLNRSARKFPLSRF